MISGRNVSVLDQPQVLEYLFHPQKNYKPGCPQGASADRSGDRSDAATPVLSKKGKADLRYTLYQAALIASIRDKYFVMYYTNKLRGREGEKGIRTKMRVKLAAKMLIIVYHVKCEAYFTGAWTLMKKKEVFYTPQAY